MKPKNATATAGTPGTTGTSDARLSMTPAERLAWLERKLAEMRGLLGKATAAERNDDPSGVED